MGLISFYEIFFFYLKLIFVRGEKMTLCEHAFSVIVILFLHPE